MTSFTWNWENKFKPWELVEHLPKAKLVPVDPTTEVGSARPVPSHEFAEWMVNYSQLLHRQTILLPHAACWPLLRSLRRLCHLDYWLIEQDAEEYLRLVEDDSVEAGPTDDELIYTADTMWFKDFDDWCVEYDATTSQADVVLLVAPPYRAASDMVAAWPYLKPRGHMVALIPKSDLFDKGDNGKLIREWCVKRELTYGVPRPKLLECSEDMVAIFGEKLHEH